MPLLLFVHVFFWEKLVMKMKGILLLTKWLLANTHLLRMSSLKYYVMSCLSWICCVVNSTWRRKIEDEEAEWSIDLWKKTLGTKSCATSRKFSCKWPLLSVSYYIHYITLMIILCPAYSKPDQPRITNITRSINKITSKTQVKVVSYNTIDIGNNNKNQFFF